MSVQGLALSPENGNLPISVGKAANREIHKPAMTNMGLKSRFDAVSDPFEES